jgi:hypothetical protein
MKNKGGLTLVAIVALVVALVGYAAFLDHAQFSKPLPKLAHHVVTR